MNKYKNPIDNLTQNKVIKESIDFYLGLFKPRGFFKCHNESTYKRIDQVCNNIIDCVYGSDELLCQYHNFSQTNCYEKSPSFIICNSDYSQRNTFSEKKFINKTLNFQAIRKIEIINDTTNFFRNSYYLVYLSVRKTAELFSHESVKFQNLIFLSLHDNRLNEFPLKTPLKILQYLNISNNPLGSLYFLKSIQVFYLLVLDISYTSIEIIEFSNFKNLVQLRELIILNVPLKIIEKGAFSHVFSLKFLILKKTKLKFKGYYYVYKYLSDIQTIEADDFRFCCLFWRFIRRNIICSPNVGYFFTCDNLISSMLKRMFYWLLGLASFFGNISAFFLAFHLKRLKGTYQLTLIMSDFLVSMYLLSIAITDVFYGNDYLQNDYVWRSSILCHLLESMMIFSLLLSNISMCLITIERYLIVANPMKKSFVTLKQNYFVFIAVIFCLILIILYFYMYKVEDKRKKFWT